MTHTTEVDAGTYPTLIGQKVATAHVSDWLVALRSENRMPSPDPSSPNRIRASKAAASDSATPKEETVFTIIPSPGVGVAIVDVLPIIGGAYHSSCRVRYSTRIR